MPNKNYKLNTDVNPDENQADISAIPSLMVTAQFATSTQLPRLTNNTITFTSDQLRALSRTGNLLSLAPDILLGSGALLQGNYIAAGRYMASGTGGLGGSSIGSAALGAIGSYFGPTGIAVGRILGAIIGGYGGSRGGVYLYNTAGNLAGSSGNISPAQEINIQRGIIDRYAEILSELERNNGSNIAHDFKREAVIDALRYPGELLAATYLTFMAIGGSRTLQNVPESPAEKLMKLARAADNMGLYDEANYWRKLAGKAGDGGKRERAYAEYLRNKESDSIQSDWKGIDDEISIPSPYGSLFQPTLDVLPFKADTSFSLDDPFWWSGSSLIGFPQIGNDSNSTSSGRQKILDAYMRAKEYYKARGEIPMDKGVQVASNSIFIPKLPSTINSNKYYHDDWNDINREIEANLENQALQNDWTSITQEIETNREYKSLQDDWSAITQEITSNLENQALQNDWSAINKEIPMPITLGSAIDTAYDLFSFSDVLTDVINGRRSDTGAYISLANYAAQGLNWAAGTDAGQEIVAAIGNLEGPLKDIGQVTGAASSAWGLYKNIEGLTSGEFNVKDALGVAANS